MAGGADDEDVAEANVFVATDKHSRQYGEHHYRNNESENLSFHFISLK